MPRGLGQRGQCPPVPSTVTAPLFRMSSSPTKAVKGREAVPSSNSGVHAAQEDDVTGSLGAKSLYRGGKTEQHLESGNRNAGKEGEARGKKSASARESWLSTASLQGVELTGERGV